MPDQLDPKTIQEAAKEAEKLRTTYLDVEASLTKINSLVEGAVDLTQKQNDLIDDGANGVELALGLSEELVAQREAQLNALTSSIDMIEDQIKALLIKRDIVGDLTVDQEKALKNFEKEYDRGKDILDQLDKKVVASKTFLKTQQKVVVESAKLVDATDEVLKKYLGLSAEAFQHTFVSKFIEAARGSLGLAGALKVVGGRAADAIKPTNLLTTSLESLVHASLEIDSAQASFNQASGAGGRYNDVIFDLGHNHLNLGIDANVAGEAIGALRDNMASFTMESKKVQKELALSTAMMTRFGVSATDAAGNLDILTRVAGMTAQGAEQAQRRLAATADALNINIGQALSEFNKVAPELASHGSNVEDVFKRLMVQSKNTGIEINRLIGIAKQFDTFEGAAGAVGKLNAILGGPFLDSMQMVHATDPAERMRMLKRAVDSAGLSYQTMTYYQRQAIASAAGLQGPAELAKLLSGELDKNSAAAQKNAMSQERMKNMAKAATSVLDQLRVFLHAIVIGIQPFISALRWVADLLFKINNALGGKFLPLMFALGAVMWVLRGRIFATVGAWVAETLAIKANTIAKKSAEKTTSSSTTSMAKSIPVMLAFGAAVLLIGGGVFLAAIGIAKMAQAIKGMSIGEMVFLAAILVGMALGIAALASVSVVAAIPLMGLGVALLLIGGAIALAGYGIKLILEGLTTFFTLLLANTDKLGLFSMQIMMLSMAMLMMLPGALAAAVGLAILSASLLGLAFSLAFIKTDDLMALGLLFTALASFTSTAVSNLLGVAEAVRNIAAAIDDVPTLKTLSFVMAVGQMANLATATGTVKTETIQNTKKLVDQAIRYQEAVEANATDRQAPLVELVEKITANETTNKTGAASVGTSGQRTIVLNIDGRELKKFVLDVFNTELNPRKIT